MKSKKQRNGLVEKLREEKTVEEVHDAAAELAANLGLMSVSVDNFDLNRLLDAYIFDLQKRAEINRILWGHPTRYPASAMPF
jgi:3-hydroxyacyl-CoA dehydrogenase